MARDDDPEDPATEAFEDLREEVAELRSTIEEFPQRVRIRTPDYAPTLAAMQKTLESIEAHPALKIKPERYLVEARTAVQAIRREVEQAVQQSVNHARQISDEISRFAGDLRTREAQRKVVIYAAAAGLGAGVVLWALVAGPIARALPASWALPERMAAATLHLDRWAAGSRLMQSANAEGYAGLMAASEILQDDAQALEACRQAADKARKPTTCSVTVLPADGDER